jgi:signal peptidase II
MKKNLWVSLIIGLTALDQATKVIFKTFWPDYVVFNDGVAFSLDMPILLPIIISFVCLGYIFYEKKSGNIEPDWTLAVFAAGILGNLIDRLLFGEVVDFIHIGSWPVFNLADVYLTSIAIYFIYIFLKLPNKTKH